MSNHEAVDHLPGQLAAPRRSSVIGFVAALHGAPGALLFGCAVGSLLTLSCWLAMPGLRRFGIVN